MARSFSNNSAICYVVPVLWMTSCFHIIRRRYLATDRTHHRTTNCTLFITFGRVRQVVAPGAKSDIYDCLVSWIGGQVYHRAVGVRSSTCSKLCQCLANATVVCRSLPCIDGLSCTHRDQIYGQYSLHPRQGCKVSQSACLCVCLSVCLSVCSHISKATRKKRYEIFWTCCTWPCLDPPLTTM